MKERFGRLAVVALSILGCCSMAVSQGKAQGQPSYLASYPATGLGKEFASETATVNGIRLHYVRGGKGKFDYVAGYPQWLERRACLSLAYATLYTNSSGIVNDMFTIFYCYEAGQIGENTSVINCCAGGALDTGEWAEFETTPGRCRLELPS
jgi:hypothetical protein